MIRRRGTQREWGSTRRRTRIDRLVIPTMRSWMMIPLWGLAGGCSSLPAPDREGSFDWFAVAREDDRILSATQLGGPEMLREVGATTEILRTSSGPITLVVFEAQAQYPLGSEASQFDSVRESAGDALVRATAFLEEASITFPQVQLELVVLPRSVGVRTRHESPISDPALRFYVHPPDSGQTEAAWTQELVGKMLHEYYHVVEEHGEASAEEEAAAYLVQLCSVDLMQPRGVPRVDFPEHWAFDGSAGELSELDEWMSDLRSPSQRGLVLAQYCIGRLGRHAAGNIVHACADTLRTKHASICPMIAPAR